MSYYQVDTVITPRGSEIEPVTLDMVKQDLNLEESFEANNAKYTRLIKFIRSEVEMAINKHIAVIQMRTESRVMPVIELPCPIVRIMSVEIQDDDGTWVKIEGWENNDRELRIPSGYRGQPVRIDYTVGMPNCPYSLINDILEGIRAVSAGQPWTPPDYPGRRVNV